MGLKAWIYLAAIAAVMLTILWLIIMDILALYMLFGRGTF